MSDDCCRMCEYRDDCPLEPEDADNDMPDCIESNSYYDRE